MHAFPFNFRFIFYARDRIHSFTSSCAFAMKFISGPTLPHFYRAHLDAELGEKQTIFYNLMNLTKTMKQERDIIVHIFSLSKFQFHFSSSLAPSLTATVCKMIFICIISARLFFFSRSLGICGVFFATTDSFVCIFCCVVVVAAAIIVVVVCWLTHPYAYARFKIQIEILTFNEIKLGGSSSGGGGLNTNHCMETN